MDTDLSDLLALLDLTSLDEDLFQGECLESRVIGYCYLVPA